jgi:hypothetical protein
MSALKENKTAPIVSAKFYFIQGNISSVTSGQLLPFKVKFNDILETEITE